MWHWLRRLVRSTTPAIEPRADERADSDRTEPDPDDAVVVVEIDRELDLHGFDPKETRAAVADYLAVASEKGFRTVRIAHGRGRGVQKQITRSVLDTHPLVESYRDDGSNWGATIVRLRGAEDSGED